MSSINVRFLNNIVLTVVQTIADESGRMVAVKKPFHIGLGDVYPVAQYQRHPDGRIDIHFPDSCPLAGVAHRVEEDCCELTEPAKIAARVTGCGGCGNKKRK